tara:strand:+ start:478 stop:1119 length:642 start_codon:yes stop_codon:yes gene_type:complete
MADEETVDTPTGSDTDWEKEYKQLQRKFNRNLTKSKESSLRLAELEAGMKRSEQLMQTLLETTSSFGDEDVRERARTTLRDFDDQRRNDSTAARFEADMSSLLDENDANWDDERLAGARRLLDEVNQTGDLTRLSEVSRLTHEALASGTNDTDSRIQEAILKDRQEHGRVDTGSSVGGGQRLTRQDVANLDPIKLGVRGMREELAKVYDQMES